MKAQLITAFALGITVAAYALGLAARKRFPSPLTTPVLFGTAIVVTVLSLTHVTFAAYGPAKGILTSLLGPATVALAVPLYKNRVVFGKHVIPAAYAIVGGSLSTLIFAAALAMLFAFRRRSSLRSP